MKMRSGPQQRGKAQAPTQGTTRNQPNTSTATGKRVKVGAGVSNSAWANSRRPVAAEFDRHPHVGAKKEKD